MSHPLPLPTSRNVSGPTPALTALVMASCVEGLVLTVMTYAEQWGNICDAKYAVCKDGKKQSPINVVSADLISKAGTDTLGWNIPVDSYDKYVKG